MTTRRSASARWRRSSAAWRGLQRSLLDGATLAAAVRCAVSAYCTPAIDQVVHRIVCLVVGGTLGRRADLLLLGLSRSPCGYRADPSATRLGTCRQIRGCGTPCVAVSSQPRGCIASSTPISSARTPRVSAVTRGRDRCVFAFGSVSSSGAASDLDHHLCLPREQHLGGPLARDELVAKCHIGSGLDRRCIVDQVSDLDVDGLLGGAHTLDHAPGV